MDVQGKQIPKTGVQPQVLLEQMQAYRANDVRWQENRAFGLVYHHSAAHTDFLKQAYTLFFSENGLNPMAFKSLQRMEREVVQMTAAMFHGDKGVIGSMTSGGTESLLLAVLTYRNYARRKRPWVRRPEIIVPESAHVGFMKGGEYFDVKIVKTPLDGDYRADVAAIRKAITRNTIAIVGSAPCYPYGVVDPVEELGAVAASRNIPLHVDGCLGGFFLPWLEKLGYEVPKFDFRVPGVTSISADIHKYGYGAKGASTILYRSLDYFRDQMFAEVDWCGGVYGGATTAGTRPGGAIAAAWASMQALGEEGYLANARRTMAATDGLKKGVSSIPGLEVLGRPAMSVFAYGSKDRRINIYAVADQMEQRGWHVDRLQKPPSIHLIINPGHAGIVDQYVADLKQAVDYVLENPDSALDGTAPMYGLIAKAPMRRMVKRNVVNILAKLYMQQENAGLDEGGAQEASPETLPAPLMRLLRLKARIFRAFDKRRP